MPTIQSQIDTLQEQIDAIKGNVAGVSPAGCNIAGLQSTITGLEGQIKTLRSQQVAADNPFSGTTMSLKFGNGNMPSLVGVNPAAVALINAIGVKPSAIVMNGVTVSVSGRDSIVAFVANETDVMVVAEALTAFALDKQVTVDVTQAQTMKSGNADKAEQLLTIAQLQEDIITTLLESNVQVTPLIPDIGTPDIVKDELSVTLDVVITGTEPITVDIHWGDDNTDTDVSLPAEHTYAEDGEYTIQIIATNDVGPDQKSVVVNVEES